MEMTLFSPQYVAILVMLMGIITAQMLRAITLYRLGLLWFRHKV